MIQNITKKKLSSIKRIASILIILFQFSVHAQNIDNYPVTSYSDDAEYKAQTGDADLWSSDLDMLYENGAFHYADALRFP